MATRNPVAVFLPSKGREQSSLLRIYNVASALKPLGWRTLIIPWKLTLAQRRRILAAATPDVLVMQGSRHELNRPDLYPGYKIVYDMDDADFHLPHLANHVRNAMQSNAMQSVDAVIAGSRYIQDWCLANGASKVDVIWTGTPSSTQKPVPQLCRLPVIAWAQTRPMTYVREAELVRRVMHDVAGRYPGATLRLYDLRDGDDPRFADSFRTPGLNVEWRRASSYREFLNSLDDVAIGLAPLCPESPFSRGKSFGKILAYLDRGVPVIASDAGEHGRFFDESSGVVSRDPEIWAKQIVGLLADPQRRQSLCDAARSDFRNRLSVEAAAALTDRTLRSVFSANKSTHPELRERPTVRISRDAEV